MATADDVRRIAKDLPRTVERLVRDRVKYNIGQIVYLALTRDEQILGFAFPREERDQMIAAQPDKFLLPEPSDMRFRWIQVRLAAIDETELRELILDAWRMCVPKKVQAEYDARDHGTNTTSG